MPQIRALPQVVEVMPVRLTMTSCQSSTDVIAMHGVDKEIFGLFHNYDLDDKTIEAFRSDKAGAIVGEKIAQRYDWEVGQHVTLAELNGISFNIHGIFSMDGAADDFIIVTGRKFLQEADNEQGLSHYVLIKARDGLDPAAVGREIDDLPLVVETTTLGEGAHIATVLAQLSDLVKLSRGIICVIIVVILIAIGNAISMATRDRAREFGILRTLGFQKRTIVMMVLGEGVIQAVIGGLIGCAMVQVMDAGNFVKELATCSVSMEFSAGPIEWIAAISTVAAAAAIGSMLPAWRSAQLDIVTALRRQD